MNKSEFLADLQEHLEGNVPSGEIYSNIQYYTQYISEQVASGKTEEEVLDALGSPLLIAKTIIEADEVSLYGRATYDETYTESSSTDRTAGNDSYDNTAYNSDSYSDSSYDSNPYDTPDEPTKTKSFHLDLTTWYGKLIAVAVAGLVIFLLITVISALIPFILIAVVVGLIISWIKRNR